jgi:hypothetical protein
MRERKVVLQSCSAGAGLEQSLTGSTTLTSTARKRPSTSSTWWTARALLQSLRAQFRQQPFSHHFDSPVCPATEEATAIPSTNFSYRRQYHVCRYRQTSSGTTFPGTGLGLCKTPLPIKHILCKEAFRGSHFVFWCPRINFSYIILRSGLEQQTPEIPQKIAFTLRQTFPSTSVETSLDFKCAQWHRSRRRRRRKLGLLRTLYRFHS